MELKYPYALDEFNTMIQKGKRTLTGMATPSFVVFQPKLVTALLTMNLRRHPFGGVSFLYNICKCYISVIHL